MKKAKITEDSIRKNKTFFHLIFPVLIIALIPSVVNGSIWYAVALKALVFFWFYVALKNFIESAI